MASSEMVAREGRPLTPVLSSMNGARWQGEKPEEMRPRDSSLCRNISPFVTGLRDTAGFGVALGTHPGGHCQGPVCDQVLGPEPGLRKCSPLGKVVKF